MPKKKLKTMEKGKKKKKGWLPKLKPAGHIEALLKRNKKMKKLLDALDQK